MIRRAVVWSPYQRTDTTRAALRLADFLVDSGWLTRVICVGAKADGVCPVWDRQVTTDPAAAADATLSIYFVYGAELIERAMSVAPRARHIYVPPWHSQPAVGITTGYPPYHLTVCPSLTQAQLWPRIFAGQIDPELVRGILWDAGWSPLVREGRLLDRGLAVLVGADAPTPDDTPFVPLVTAAAILEHLSSATVTLWASGSWPRRARRMIRSLLRHYGPRLTYVARPSRSQWRDLFLRHDCYVETAPRSSFATGVAAALVSGIPVVAWDVPPFSEFVRPEQTGWLVPTDRATDRHGAVSALAAVSPFAARVVRYLQQTDAVIRLQPAVAQFAHDLTATFAAFWSSVTRSV